MHVYKLYTTSSCNTTYGNGAGTLNRATACYKLSKIGRARDALNREQDEEIDAIANMLAATR